MTRVGSGSRLRSNGTPPLAWRTTRRGTAPGVDSSRTSGDDRPVFPDPSGSWPGFPVPLVDRVTLASP